MTWLNNISFQVFGELDYILISNQEAMFLGSWSEMKNTEQLKNLHCSNKKTTSSEKLLCTNQHNKNYYLECNYNL